MLKNPLTHLNSEFAPIFLRIQSDISAKLSQFFDGLKTIKASGCQEFTIKKFSNDFLDLGTIVYFFESIPV